MRGVFSVAWPPFVQRVTHTPINNVCNEKYAYGSRAHPFETDWEGVDMTGGHCRVSISANVRDISGSPLFLITAKQCMPTFVAAQTPRSVELR